MEKTNILMSAIIISLIIIFLIKTPSNGHDFCLTKSYEFYKNNYMSKDGRIMDPQRNYITTSEGQSYMLLRSLLENDKTTFDLVYSWTKSNLQRPDKLFSWLWGENKYGDYKILDKNTASDADVDIAFALILAYEKWGNKQYLNAALPIIKAIREKETKQIENYLVLMPGVEQVNNEKIEINPSYFSPYAFRIFQKYDENTAWDKLIDSSYYYLISVMSKTHTGLPPDWFSIKNNQIIIEDSPRSDFSYDAIRVFARIFLDYHETKEPRALNILDKSTFFINEWEKNKKFYVNYKSNGEVKNKDEFIGSIAILIPVINMYDEKIAEEIYNEKLFIIFEKKCYWTNKKDYYGQNLLWFGIYLYKNLNNEE